MSRELLPGTPGVPSDSSDSLPLHLEGTRAPIVWGVVFLVLIEATLLCLWAVSYLYLRMGVESWPPPGVARPGLLWPTIGQLLLLLSPMPIWIALRSARDPASDDAPPRMIPIAMLLASGYLALKAWEYWEKDYLWTSHAYGSLDWSMSAYAVFHVIVVLLAGAVMWAFSTRGELQERSRAGLQALLIYWVFVALGSLLFFGTQYLVPIL